MTNNYNLIFIINKIIKIVYYKLINIIVNTLYFIKIIFLYNNIIL